jgi:hypothetical protein
MSEPLFLMREALKKMFRPEGYFDICALNAISEAFGIIVPSDTHAKLRMLHCISWREMEPETRRWVAITIDSLLSNPDNIASNFLPQVLGGKPMVMSDVTRNLIKDKA